MSEVAKLAPETETSVRNAIAQIDEILAEAVHYGPAVVNVLSALRTSLVATHRQSVDTILTVQQAAERVRTPVTPDEMRRYVAEGVRVHATTITKELVRRHILAGLVLLVVVAAAGFGAGWLSRGDGVAQACATRGEIHQGSHGGQYCSIWLTQ